MTRPIEATPHLATNLLSPARARSGATASELSPDALLTAAQSGDMAALSTLFHAHRHGVYRYGLKVCRTTEDAEDAVQETLWTATRAIQSFRGSASSVVSWLFTIVRRECLRLIDRHRRAPAGLDGGEDRFAAIGLNPEDTAASRQRAQELAAALRDLDPLHREVLLLRDIQEFSAPEAAERLGISVDALKSRLHRARAQLRERLCSSHTAIGLVDEEKSLRTRSRSARGSFRGAS